MRKEIKQRLVWSAIIVVILALAVFFIVRAQKPGKLDTFAQCLKTQRAIFYGAFWCPHCQKQKAEFGRSAHLLPYVECSTPDGQGQLMICTQNNISGYPTWVFKDGSRLTGEIPLTDLAAKTGCPLPQ